MVAVVVEGVVAVVVAAGAVKSFGFLKQYDVRVISATKIVKKRMKFSCETLKQKKLILEHFVTGSFLFFFSVILIFFLFCLFSAPLIFVSPSIPIVSEVSSLCVPSREKKKEILLCSILFRSQ